MFLTNLDYTSHQSDIDMTILTKSNNVRIRNFAENAAVSRIKSYLRKRFQINELFIHVRIWNSYTTYSIGDHVEFDGQIYYAEVASLDSEPEPDSLEWTLGDLRDPELVMYAIDIVLYHLYAKVSKRQTPTDVNDRYLDAIDWLKGVSKGTLLPNFPEIIPNGENQTNHVQWGSQEKINHRY